MLNVSKECLEAINSIDRQFTYSILINGVDELKIENIYSIEIEENGASNESLSIGEFNRNQLTLTVATGAYSKWIGSYLEITCRVNGIEEDIPLGKYYVSSAESKNNFYTTEVIAYDLPEVINEKVDITETNVQKIIAQIEEKIGVQLKNKNELSLANITQIPTDCTYMNLLGYIAGFDGFNIRTDRKGNLELYKYNFLNPNIDITPDKIYSDGTSYKTSPMTVGKVVAVNGEMEFEKGSGLEVRFENPFIDNSEEVPTDYINKTYYSCEFGTVGNPLIQIGDSISLQFSKERGLLYVGADCIVGENAVIRKFTESTISAEKILCLNMHQKISIDGGMKSTINSYTSEEVQNTIGSESPTMKKINQAKKDMAKTLREAMSNVIGANNGYYSLIDKDGNPLTFNDLMGGKVPTGWQDTDSPTITSITKGWRFTYGGLGYSNDGMKTFTIGIDREGHINGGMLSINSITEDKLSEVLGTTINDASKNAENALTKYGDLDAKVTQQFNVYDGKFESMVTMETLNSLDLTHKNLVLQSDVEAQVTESGKYVNYKLSEKTQSGEKYVFSVYGDFNYVTSMNIQVGSLPVKMYYSPTYDRYYCKFSPQSTGVNATNLYLYINLNQSGSNPIATITKVKLEKGTDITSWSQAPEDYATTIQMNSAIRQSADAISLEVSKKVGKDEIISAINMSAEGIGIQASKINLTFGSDKETMTLRGNTNGVLFDGTGCFEVDTVGGFNLENYSDSTKAHVRNDIYTSYSSTVQSLILRNMSYDFSKIANTISLSGYQTGYNNILLKNRGNTTVSNDLNLNSNGEKMQISLGNLDNNINYYINLIRLISNSDLKEVNIANGLDSNSKPFNQIYMDSTSARNMIQIKNKKTDGTLAGSIEFYSDKSATSGQTLMLRGGNSNGDMWMGMSQDLVLIRYSNYTDRFELNSSSAIMAHGSQSISVTNSNGINMYVNNQNRLYINSSGIVNAFNGHHSGIITNSIGIPGGDGPHYISFGWDGKNIIGYVDGYDKWHSSDERMKTDIFNISDVFVNAIGSVDIKQFKFSQKLYNQNLVHFGVIAQDLRRALEDNGCDLNNLGVTGIFKNLDEDTEYYSVDKEEFLMARIAYDEKRIKELESRLEKYEKLRTS